MRGSLAVALASLASALPARAAPKVAVVMVTAEGIPADQADALAYDLAAAVATQIEGEAIAGASVRERMPPGQPTEGCEESAACGRNLANALSVDEVLLLAAHQAGKTTVVGCHRVPRDPTRPPSDRTLRVLGGKAKRAKAILELVTALYPPGSVQEFAAPAPVAEEKPAPAVEPPVSHDEKPAAESRPRPAWLWYAIGGGAAAAVLALVLGLTLGLDHSPTGPTVTLP